jgi:hypothetical protein
MNERIGVDTVQTPAAMIHKILEIKSDCSLKLTTMTAQYTRDYD